MTKNTFSQKVCIFIPFLPYIAYNSAYYAYNSANYANNSAYFFKNYAYFSHFFCSILHEIKHLFPENIPNYSFFFALPCSACYANNSAYLFRNYAYFFHFSYTKFKLYILYEIVHIFQKILALVCITLKYIIRT